MATHWKLAEVMARHHVLGKEIAQSAGVSEDTVTKWKRSPPPFERWDAIAEAITAHSRIGGDRVRGVDLVENVSQDTQE